jgi:flagellin
MSLRINYNLASSVAQRSLNSSQETYARMAERLATGLRINKSSDDAAGMAVSERLKNQVRGLTMAGRNAQDGVSLIQTAEGALTETHTILARLRELAVQAANDTLNNTDRANLQTEANQLVAEIDRIAASTQFNGTLLLNKNSTVSLHGGGDGLQFQIGANKNNSATNDNIFNLYMAASRTQDLGDVEAVNAARASGTQVTALGANTVTVGTASGVKYNAEVDTIFDVRDAINAAGGDLTASVKNGKLRLESLTSASASASIGTDSGDLVSKLFATTATSNTATGSTTLEDVGITADGTLTVTATVATGDIAATSGVETLAEIGVGGSGTLTVTFDGGATTNQRTVAVAYTSAETLSSFKTKLDEIMIQAAAGASGATNVAGTGAAAGATYSVTAHTGAITVNASGSNATIAASVFTIDAGTSNRVTAIADSRSATSLIAALGLAANGSTYSGTAQTAATTGTTGLAVGGKVQRQAQTETASVTYLSTESLSTVAARIGTAVSGIGAVGSSSVATLAGATGSYNAGTSAIDLASLDADATLSFSGAAASALGFASSPAAGTSASGAAITQNKYRLDSVALVGVTSISSGTGGILDLGTQTAASAAISLLDVAVSQVSGSRASLGAMQNRLESATRSLAIATENAAAANSRIADADVAQSMSDLVRAQILQQAGISVLAQANQAPSLVLQLLK